ncbi:MAG: O-antigen ligase family protein [Acidobacteriota bacterium]
MTSILVLLLGYHLVRSPGFHFSKRNATLFTIIFLFQCVNIFLSFSPGRSVEAALYYFLLFILFLALPGVFTFFQTLTLLRIMTFLAAAVSFYGLHQYFFGLEKLASIIRKTEMEIPSIFLEKLEAGRVFSTFVTPGAFAGFLLMTIPVTAFFVFLSENRKLRTLYGALLLIQTASFFLSFSIGALVALFASALIVASLKLRRRMFIISIIMIVFITAAVFFLMYRDIGFSEFWSSDSPLKLRYGNWKASILMIGDHPVLGVGGGSYGVAFSRYREEWMNESNYAHNSFLQIVSENGLFAVPFLLAFLCIFFRSAWELLRRHRIRAVTSSDPSASKNNSNVARLKGAPFLAMALLSFILHNLSDFTFYLPSVSFLFFPLCGLFFSMGAGLEEEPGDRRENAYPAGLGEYGGKRSFGKILLILLLAVSALFFLSSFIGEISFEEAMDARESVRFEEADRLLRRAKFFNALKSDYRIYRAQLLMDEKNPSRDPMRALGEVERAIALDPFIPYYHRVASDIHLLSGDPIQAYISISKAASLYPADEHYKARRDTIWTLLKGGTEKR